MGGQLQASVFPAVVCAPYAPAPPLPTSVTNSAFLLSSMYCFAISDVRQKKKRHWGGWGKIFNFFFFYSLNEERKICCQKTKMMRCVIVTRSVFGCFLGASPLPPFRQLQGPYKTDMLPNRCRNKLTSPSICLEVHFYGMVWANCEFLTVTWRRC